MKKYNKLKPNDFTSIKNYVLEAIFKGGLDKDCIVTLLAIAANGGDCSEKKLYETLNIKE